MSDDSNAIASKPDSARGPRAQVVILWLFVLVTIGLLLANVRTLTSQLDAIAQNSRERAFWALCHSGTTGEQRTELFLQLVAEGNTEWRSARLEKLSLTGADLSGALLESAVFSSCDFEDADFSEARLNKAGLDNSDLSRARFFKAQIRNATFFKSELNEADFRNADLLSTSFEQAKIHGATFVTAKMGDAFLAMADLTDSDLTGADLSGANLEATVLKNVDLALANLYGTRLEDTDFTNSNWWRARGLNSAELDRLTVEFPPSVDAADSRQRDFRIWLAQRVEDSDRDRPRPE